MQREKEVMRRGEESPPSCSQTERVIQFPAKKGVNCENVATADKCVRERERERGRQ